MQCLENSTMTFVLHRKPTNPDDGTLVFRPIKKFNSVVAYKASVVQWELDCDLGLKNLLYILSLKKLHMQDY